MHIIHTSLKFWYFYKDSLLLSADNRPWRIMSRKMSSLPYSDVDLPSLQVFGWMDPDIWWSLCPVFLFSLVLIKRIASSSTSLRQWMNHGQLYEQQEANVCTWSCSMCIHIVLLPCNNSLSSDRQLFLTWLKYLQLTWGWFCLLLPW